MWLQQLIFSARSTPTLEEMGSTQYFSFISPTYPHTQWWSFISRNNRCSNHRRNCCRWWMGSWLYKKSFRNKNRCNFQSALEIGRHYLAAVLSDHPSAGANWLPWFDRGVPNFKFTKWIWTATCNYPQVFLGSISFISPLNNSLNKLLSSPIIISAGLLFKQLYQTLLSTFFPDTSAASHSTITDPSPPHTIPSCHNTNHPYFSCISDTHYQITKPRSHVATTIHVGQITDYVNFDEDVWTHGGMTRIRSMPLGYPKFTNLWNMGTQHGDHQQFSHIYIPEGAAEYQVQLFLQLVDISKFAITKTQIGMAPPTSTLQAELTQEFAYVMMEQHRNSRRGFERRQDWWMNQINQRPASRPGNRLCHIQFTCNQHQMLCLPHSTCHNFLQQWRRGRTSWGHSRAWGTSCHRCWQAWTQLQWDGIWCQRNGEHPVNIHLFRPSKNDFDNWYSSQLLHLPSLAHTTATSTFHLFFLFILLGQTSLVAHLTWRVHVTKGVQVSKKKT